MTRKIQIKTTLSYRFIPSDPEKLGKFCSKSYEKTSKVIHIDVPVTWFIS